MTIKFLRLGCTCKQPYFDVFPKYKEKFCEITNLCMTENSLSLLFLISFPAKNVVRPKWQSAAKISTSISDDPLSTSGH